MPKKQDEGSGEEEEEDHDEVEDRSWSSVGQALVANKDSEGLTINYCMTSFVVCRTWKALGIV